MTYEKNLEKRISQNQPSYLIAREMYLHANTFVFDHYDCFSIINEVSEYFQIPFHDVHIAGSSKMGKSYYKKKDFSPGDSDLDIAIINNDLFTKYTEDINKLTNGFQNLTSFEEDNFILYRDYILKGIIRCL